MISRYLALGLFVLLSIYFWAFSIDDAYISYRHALNWSSGWGPVMNPGERVEGISNLPWTAMLACFVRANVAPHVVAPIVAGLLGLFCIFLTANLSERFCGEIFQAQGHNLNRKGGWAALFLAASAPLAIWGRSGLETVSYTVFICLLMLQVLRSYADPKAIWRIGALAGCVAAMRPEGLLLTIPVLWFLIEKRGWRGRWWRDLLGGLLWVIVPLEIARLVFYGDLLPNTVYAKGSLGAIQPGSVYLLKMMVAFPLILPSVWFGRSLQSSASRLLANWVLIQLAFAMVVGGERFPGYRFLVPALPAAAILLAVALRSLECGARISFRATRACTLVLGIVGLGAVPIFIFPSTIIPWGEGLLGWLRTYENADLHRPRLIEEARFAAMMLFLASLSILVFLRTRRPVAGRRHQENAASPGYGINRGALRVAGVWLVALLLPVFFDPSLQLCRQADPAAALGAQVGRYLKSNEPPGTLVATNAAGALPYFSELPVIDMLGLTDEHIARQSRNHDQWLGHEKGDGAYVLSRHPALVILGGAEGSRDPWPFQGDQEIHALPEFRRAYHFERVDLGDFEFQFYRRRESSSLELPSSD